MDIGTKTVISEIVLIKYGPIPASFLSFRPFVNTMTNLKQSIIQGKSVDGELWIRTRDHRMECTDESTELSLSCD